MRNLLLLILFLIVSCSKQDKAIKIEHRTYEKDKLSFSLPVGWKVVNDTVDKVRYLELNKYENYNVVSTMTIGIFNNDHDGDSLLDSQIKQLQYFYHKVNFKITEEKKPSEMGKIKVDFMSYEADDTKTKVYGKIGIIKDQDKIMSIQIVENKPFKDMSDYQEIFNTLKIK